MKDCGLLSNSLRSLALALTIPAVTVEVRLKGFPTASTHSPTFTGTWNTDPIVGNSVDGTNHRTDERHAVGRCCESKRRHQRSRVFAIVGHGHLGGVFGDRRASPGDGGTARYVFLDAARPRDVVWRPGDGVVRRHDTEFPARHSRRGTNDDCVAAVDLDYGFDQPDASPVEHHCGWIQFQFGRPVGNFVGFPGRGRSHFSRSGGRRATSDHQRDATQRGINRGRTIWRQIARTDTASS